jgi:hypothetical protein
VTQTNPLHHGVRRGSRRAGSTGLVPFTAALLTEVGQLRSLLTGRQ